MEAVYLNCGTLFPNEKVGVKNTKACRAQVFPNGCTSEVAAQEIARVGGAIRVGSPGADNHRLRLRAAAQDRVRCAAAQCQNPRNHAASRAGRTYGLRERPTMSASAAGEGAAGASAVASDTGPTASCARAAIPAIAKIAASNSSTVSLIRFFNAVLLFRFWQNYGICAASSFPHHFTNSGVRPSDPRIIRLGEPHAFIERRMIVKPDFSPPPRGIRLLEIHFAQDLKLYARRLRARPAPVRESLPDRTDRPGAPDDGCRRIEMGVKRNPNVVRSRISTGSDARSSTPRMAQVSPQRVSIQFSRRKAMNKKAKKHAARK